jgi:hypothetical protein
MSAGELQSGAWSVWHDNALSVTGGGLASKLKLTGLPAGSYVIIAKANWVSWVDRFVMCRLVAESDFDDATFEARVSSEGVVTATVVHTFAGGGSVVDLQCRLTTSGTVSLYDTKITAIKVGTLVNTPG